MDYRQMLIDVMMSSKYKGKTLDELKILMNVDTAKEFTEFMKAFNELEDEVVIIADKKDRYFLAEKLGYFKGILHVNPRGFGFVENEEVRCYVSEDEMNYAVDKDEVVAQSWVNYDGSSECRIVRIIKHNLSKLVGTVKIKDGRKYFLPDSETIDARIKITNYNDFKLINDMKVLVQITKFGKALEAKIIEVIGYKYDPGVDILSVLLEHDIDPEFNEDVKEELRKVPEKVTRKDLEGREDLRDELIITIDGDDARDLDDAVSVKKIEHGYRLGVHIADVSYYVKAGSAIDQEAYARGTSVYVTDRVVPMLPHLLSNGICSLNPRVDRCTISCVMDINEKGEVFNYRIFPSVIKTTERMTYNNVNGMINGDEELCQKYAHILDMVKEMLALSKIVRERRHRLGSIDFDTREGKVIVDEKGKPIDVVVRERGEAERIIEDFMICANECVATHVKWQELPSIYRVHDVPDAKKMCEFVHIAQLLGVKFKGNVVNVRPKQCQQILEEAKKRPEYSVLSTSLLRCMAKAKYDPNCLGHFGLALSEYTHFTSPIRRYPDLIVHRMLRKYCFGPMPSAKVMQKDEKWIEKAAIQCSERERIAVDAEREVDDMKKAEYMENHIGEIYEGVISSVLKFGIFVELPNTVEGLVHVTNMNDDHYVFDEVTKSLVGERTRNRYTMGQKVKVKVTGASRFKRQVDFEVVKKVK